MYGQKNGNTKKNTDTIEERKLQGLSPDSDVIIRKYNVKRLIPEQNREKNCTTTGNTSTKGQRCMKPEKKSLESKKDKFGPSYITVSNEEIQSTCKGIFGDRTY